MPTMTQHMKMTAHQGIIQRLVVPHLLPRLFQRSIGPGVMVSIVHAVKWEPPVQNDASDHKLDHLVRLKNPLDIKAVLTRKVNIQTVMHLHRVLQPPIHLGRYLYRGLHQRTYPKGFTAPVSAIIQRTAFLKMKRYMTLSTPLRVDPVL